MKDNLSEFIKKAYESGRVMDLSEAFKEYPPEEEWHKGDAIALIGESKVEYLVKYNVGDIVYVKEFLYPNDSIGYNHLFVIVDEENISVHFENVSAPCGLLRGAVDLPALARGGNGGCVFG